MKYEDVIKLIDGHGEIISSLYEVYLAYIETLKIEKTLPFDFNYSITFRLYEKDLISHHYEIYKRYTHLEHIIMRDEYIPFIAKQEKEFEKKVMELSGVKNNDILFEKNEVIGNKLFFRRNLQVFLRMNRGFDSFLLHFLYSENKKMYSNSQATYEVYKGDQLRKVFSGDLSDYTKIQMELKLYLKDIGLEQNKVLLRFLRGAISTIKNYNRYVLALLEARKIKEMCMEQIFDDMEKLNKQEEKTF